MREFSAIVRLPYIDPVFPDRGQRDVALNRVMPTATATAPGGQATL